MRKIGIVLCSFGVALLIATSSLASEDNSYLFVTNGKAITNGAPMNVKAVKAKYSGSYFWFSLDGKRYLTRDAATLEQIKKIYASLFSGMGEFIIAEPFEVLLQQERVKEEQKR